MSPWTRTAAISGAVVASVPVVVLVGRCLGRLWTRLTDKTSRRRSPWKQDWKQGECVCVCVSARTEWTSSMSPWTRTAAISGAVVASVPVVVLVGRCLGRLWTRLTDKTSRRRSPWKQDWKQGVIYLYNWPRSSSIPSLSPFGMKLETWFRMADLPYENVDIPILVNSKEGMRPFVEYNGVEYADSGLIMLDLANLVEKGRLEAHLTEEQKAAGRALERMAEMSIWWVYFSVRYVENCNVFLDEVFGSFEMTTFQRTFLKVFLKGFGVQQKAMKKVIVSTGLGRHSRADMMRIGLTDLRAISQYLGEKPYMMGDQPTKVDAALFGLLSQIEYFHIDSELRDATNGELANLRAYADRIKDRYWPDWDEILRTRSLHTKWRTEEAQS